MEKVDVVIIGAGCAGLSAGVRLAGAGRRVVVIEEAPRLGGRATSFRDREGGEQVDNGQHVLFGCYRETFAFLEAIGTSQLAPIEPALCLEFASVDGRRGELMCPGWPPPLHLLGGVLSWDALPMVERFRILRLAGLLRRVRRDGASATALAIDPALTVTAWLDRHGQTRQLRQWLWEPLAWAALNQSPEVASAQSFVRVLGELFGPRAEDASLSLPRVPLDELYAEPAARHIEARGGRVVRRCTARIVMGAGGDWSHVHTPESEFAAGAIISAVPWHAFGRLWEGGAPASLSAIAADAARVESLPIVTVNLWFDRPAMTRPVVGLVGATMHWAFDKGAIFGGRAGHVSMVASGATEILRADNAAMADVAERDLKDALPSARAAVRTRAVVVREPRATFSLAPGAPPRPATVTPLEGFFLAGDWTDTGLPGTIEGAVLSGHRAAEEILRRAGGRGSGGLT